MDAARSARLADLIARTALADQQAFAALYRETSASLFGIALRIVRERALAEDLLQEAFVAIWSHAASYAPAKSQPMTWLIAIVRHRCLDSLRRRALDTESLAREDDQPELDIASDEPGPAELLLRGADEHSVRDCVERLEGGSKQAIALAFFQGLTHAELAAHLREPLGTVKSWVRRGLERLRGCLEQAGAIR